MHKSGFVNIIGMPNAGKSTLLNALIGQRLSIVTPKAQTTRKRIIGLLNKPDYQIVFSDTPGILQPEYNMHDAMMTTIRESFHDADLIIYLVDANVNEAVATGWMEVVRGDAPVLVVINKMDLLAGGMLERKIDFWKAHPRVANVMGISALHKKNMKPLMQKILERLPEHEAYFPKDDISNRDVRFFCAEFVREKILEQYHEEIPFHTEVVVQDYTEKPAIDVLLADIIVNKAAHKKIIIGKDGAAIKKLGTAARKVIEEFVGKKVYLELSVKVKENWITDDYQLYRLGYIDYRKSDSWKKKLKGNKQQSNEEE